MPDEDITVNLGEEPEVVVAHAEDQRSDQSSMSELPSDGLDDLRRQLAESEAARQRSDELAAENARRATNAESIAIKNYNAAITSNAEAQEREYDSVVTSLRAEETRQEQLKVDLIRAQSDGEFEKVADIQVALGRTAARLENLEAGKAALDNARKAQPAPVKQVEAPAESQAQFNARPWRQQEANNVMSTTSPQTAAWMRANPRYFTDPGWRQQVQGADAIMRGRGIAVDTPEYFSGVEKIIGISQESPPASYTPPREEHVSSASKASSRSSPTPAAPPSRSVPTPDGQRNNNGTTVTLTKEQRDMAKIMFHDHPNPEKAYAIHWNELRKEGKLKEGGIVL